jgi:guanosine-3',5'-bis(diphosphate) 3'-pyrophosphohydrolase
MPVMKTPAEQLSMAIALAATRHAGQFDKGGKPYILHTLKVMHYLKTEDLELMAAAVMHDIIEDTDTTYEELREMGFSERVIAAVRGMTKIKGQTPAEYLAQVLSNIDSALIKLADLRHNSDIRRLKGATEKDIKRIEKYQRMFTTIKEYLISEGIQVRV